MGKKYNWQERQARQLAFEKRRQVAVYVGLGILSIAAVSIVLYALA